MILSQYTKEFKYNLTLATPVILGMLGHTLVAFVDNIMVAVIPHLNLDKFVNLLNVNKQGLFISENSYSLKNIEKFYDFKRQGDIQKGDVSQEYYSEWMETQDQKYLDEIESYNKQDCRSTYELHQWLLKIKPKETSWFISQKKDEEMKLRDWEIDMINYQKKVENSEIKDKKLKQLMFDIIGFYNRENKPDWREFFPLLSTSFQKNAI